MRLVPVEAAMVALPAASLREVSRALVRVGARVEVDIDALTDAEARSALERYVGSLAGQASGPGVSIDVSLVDARQSTSKGSMRDLNAELAALEVVPGCRPLLEVLGPEPASAVSGVRSRRTGDGLTVASVRVSSAIWPVELGGPPSPREVSRLVRITASHAPWRDRRARRLIRVEAVSRQVWPAPARPH